MHTLQFPFFPPSSSMVRSQDGRTEELVCSSVGNKVGLCPRTSVRYPDFIAASSHGSIYLLHLKLTILSVCDTLIHLEELRRLGVLLCPINASIAVASLSRPQSDPLGACRSRFLLGEESKVILEQFELGALRESTLPRHYLIIYFGEFLTSKGVNSQN
jgi:hypothetical protein